MSGATRVANPFRSIIVSDAWQSGGVDVSDIHADDFEKCCEAVEHVRRERSSTGLLIHGEPGAGKTHLLSRLRRHLVDEPSESGARQCRWFVNIGLHTAPSRIWRHVRRRVVEDLLRKPEEGGPSQLEAILCDRLAAVRSVEGDVSRWWSYIRDADNFDDLLESLDELLEHRDLTRVVGHWLRRRHLSVSRSWLRGDSLPEEDRQVLGIARIEEPDEADSEAAAEKVVTALCRLAPAETPIVFCFDQIEAIQTDTADNAGLQAFGRMISALRHQTRNAVLISCVQSQFLGPLRTINQADYARVCEFGLCFLEPLNADQARRLIVARLATVAGRSVPFEVLEPELNRIVGIGCTPRKLLAECAALFDQAERLPPRRETQDQFFERTWDEQLEAAQGATSPEQMADTLNHALPMLVRLTGDWEPQADAKQRDIDCTLVHPDARIGISVCSQENMTSLAGRLRRLREVLTKGPWQKLVLIRHPHSQIRKTAAAARKYWEELREGGAVVLHPSLEALAALEALRRLISAAHAGDLAFQGDTVAVATLEDWLKQRLPACLKDLAEELVAYPREVSPELPGWEDLAELLGEECLASVDDIAQKMGCSEALLRGMIEARPQHFGLLSPSRTGAPAVVYRLEAVVAGT